MRPLGSRSFLNELLEKSVEIFGLIFMFPVILLGIFAGVFHFKIPKFVILLMLIGFGFELLVALGLFVESLWDRWKSRKHFDVAHGRWLPNTKPRGPRSTIATH